MAQTISEARRYDAVGIDADAREIAEAQSVLDDPRNREGSAGLAETIGQTVRAQVEAQGLRRRGASDRGVPSDAECVCGRERGARRVEGAVRVEFYEVVAGSNGDRAGPGIAKRARNLPLVRSEERRV